MKKRKYFYMISYSCTTNDGKQGDGCSQLYFSYKINTIERFNSALELLKVQNNLNIHSIFPQFEKNGNGMW